MTLTLADLRMDLADDGEVGKDSRPRSDRPKRRSFTPEYKLAMVEAYDAATEPGAKGDAPVMPGRFDRDLLDPLAHQMVTQLGDRVHGGVPFLHLGQPPTLFLVVRHSGHLPESLGHIDRGDSTASTGNPPQFSRLCGVTGRDKGTVGKGPLR
ncbi:hypothetical protein AB0O34_11570 [Sphaerisporangium sp. NPDC088356]|uniref:hypothetical protein n=1 Tax=Sphaerisporangium sp. NPDC088356 TaxID=3154871 RepID=UPI00343DE5DB